MMKSLLVAVCFLFVSSQVEATSCYEEAINQAKMCLKSVGFDWRMFADNTKVIQIYKKVCKNEKVFGAALECVETALEKCKEDKSVGTMAAIMSQIDMNNVRTAFLKGCSHIGDLDGQEDCFVKNLPILTTCSITLQHELAQNAAMTNPSQANIVDLMCSRVTEANKCIQSSFGSCGKAASVMSDFMEGTLPKKPCP